MAESFQACLNKNVVLGLRTFSNLNVLHKDLLLQDWVFRLGFDILFLFILVDFGL